MVEKEKENGKKHRRNRIVTHAIHAGKWTRVHSGTEIMPRVLKGGEKGEVGNSEKARARRARYSECGSIHQRVRATSVHVLRTHQADLKSQSPALYSLPSRKRHASNKAPGTIMAGR